MTKFIWKVFLIFCLFISGCVTNVMDEATKGIRQEKAIEVASKEAANLGYDVTQIETGFVKRFNSDSLDSNADRNLNWINIIEIRSKLENRNFWAVLLGPKEPILGGTIWIFIDSDSGEVIATLGGK